MLKALNLLMMKILENSDRKGGLIHVKPACDEDPLELRQVGFN